VSLHGGHSSGYCDHATSTLAEILEAACDAGMRTYGVTEHAPRVEPERLYDEEVALGWDIGTLERLFGEYAAEVDRLKREYAGSMNVLKGFEAEVVPVGRYAEVMKGFREKYGFDYIVGSVHYVAGHIIDYLPGRYEKAVAICGSPEALAVRYFQDVAGMVEALHPEVVGHLDLYRRRFASDEAASTPPIRRAAMEALEVIRENNAIIDVNTAGLRLGLGYPYPAPWLVTAARDMGVSFCFGDDSHNITQVSSGINDAREYLMSLGVTEIETLEPGVAGLYRKKIDL
jgi:histidinol-phosphatase (PHP family)